MYPSIQAKIWGNIGQVSELIDMVLDSFIKRSVTGGLGSAQVNIITQSFFKLKTVRNQPHFLYENEMLRTCLTFEFHIFRLKSWRRRLSHYQQPTLLLLLEK